MWHYEMGTEQDFADAPSDCLMIYRSSDSAELLHDCGDHRPNSVKIVAYREWVSDEGWVEWGGGECPLDGGDIDVRLRGGRFIFRRGARSIGGNWIHDGGRKDIVAYRVRQKSIPKCNDDEPIPF